MAINIKNPQVEADIRLLAGELGLDLTEAIRLAVHHELKQGKQKREMRLRRMRAVADRVAALPLKDTRSAEEILGYDDAGLPS